MSLPACPPACLYVLLEQFIRPKMVLTANQVRAFFHADNQMEIPVATIVQLVQEGIEHPDIQDHPLEQQQPITLSLYELITLSLYALINLSDCVPACLPTYT